MKKLTIADIRIADESIQIDYGNGYVDLQTELEKVDRLTELYNKAVKDIKEIAQEACDMCRFCAQHDTASCIFCDRKHDNWEYRGGKV